MQQWKQLGSGNLKSSSTIFAASISAKVRSNEKQLESESNIDPNASERANESHFSQYSLQTYCQVM